MPRPVLLCFFLLLACGRPLAPEERIFAGQLYGDSLDPSRVRLHDGALIGKTTHTRPRRPRLTCRERILPEPATETVTVSPAAFVLYNHVFFARKWYSADFLAGYPEDMNLVRAMLFAHEMTHVWQWQNRRKTGYAPFRSAGEHVRSRNPYLFEVDAEARFLDYGYEQQASLVEEYVCCATLDASAPRTRRLRDMLSGAVPLQQLTIPDSPILPGTKAETPGICR